MQSHRATAVRRSLSCLLTVAVLASGPRRSSLLAAGIGDLGPFAQSQTAPTGLTIVILEGEDAVNVRQKTAIAPMVEVRDRNDQPVAGVVVRFAINSGRASFSGSRILAVPTNAAGRAVATGLIPTGKGAVQIGVSVAFQGQTAVATIAQTKVMTAAQAAGASAASGAGSGSAAGGGGGGLSATTLGVVGGAAAGGAVVARKVLRREGVTYTGALTGPLLFFVEASGARASCTRTEDATGTLTLTLQTDGDGTVSGRASGSSLATVVTSGNCGGLNDTHNWGGFNSSEVTGTTGNFVFTAKSLFPGIGANEWTFSGALAGDVVTGTLILTVTVEQSGLSAQRQTGRATFAVTAR